MKVIKYILPLSVILLSVGCATKRYHIATELSPAVGEAMTCRELEFELIKGEDIERQINETGNFDARTVFGFLGDFGIGNAMAKSEAQIALSNRISSIRTAQSSKGCLGKVSTDT